MSVKAALVMGAAIIVAFALWIYFSPYHTCVRWGHANDRDNAEIACAAAAADR